MLESEPQLALQVTAVFVVFFTVAVKECVALVSRLTLVGATVIDTGTVTVTVACAHLVGSATLVALTMQVAAMPGAV